VRVAANSVRFTRRGPRTLATVTSKALWKAYLDERGVIATCPVYENWSGHVPTMEQQPFEALLWFLGTERKPPAELVNFVIGRWKDYMEGRTEFEAALLGPRKRRAGNYAAQQRADRQKAALTMEFIRLHKTGMTKRAAAANIVERYRLHSVDAFLKMAAAGRRKKTRR
jgi:hypothetical protein